jgi:hypothetical protein
VAAAAAELVVDKADHAQQVCSSFGVHVRWFRHRPPRADDDD